MNFLLLQNELCIYDKRYELAAKYPNSSIIWTSGTNFPKEAPILTDYWVVFVTLSQRNILKQIQQIKQAEDFCHFVIVTSNKSGVVQKVMNECALSYEVIENMNVSEQRLIGFIRQELNVSESLAKIICRRSKKYEPLVIKNVRILGVLGEGSLTLGAVKKYLTDYDIVGFRYLYQFVMKGEGEYKRVINLVYRYQFSIATICNYLCHKIKEDILVFSEIMDGSLTKDNYVLYGQQHKIPYYELQQTLELFDKITLETLYIKFILFDSLKKLDCMDFIMKGCKK